MKIVQTDHKRLLIRAIDTYLSDGMSKWEMNPDGTWRHLQFDEHGNRLQDLHAASIEWYRARG